MTTPTPAQLAESITDLGRGYTAEIPGLPITPDPLLGARLAAHAKRIQNRVKPNDPRLNSFTGHTDPAGYYWAPEPVHQYLTTADENWSFERWFTGLAEATAAVPARSNSDLAELVGDAAAFDSFGRAGLRPVEIAQTDSTTFTLFKRPKP